MATSAAAEIATAPAARRQMRFLPPPLAANDRISEFRIAIDNADIVGIQGLPSGWIVTVDNDPSAGVHRPPGSATIIGQAHLGVAYISDHAFARLRLVFVATGARPPRASVTIANPLRGDRISRVTIVNAGIAP